MEDITGFPLQYIEMASPQHIANQQPGIDPDKDPGEKRENGGESEQTW